MNREETISVIKSILRAGGIKKAYLFGSFARNEKKCNDIDIAIKPPRGISLLDLAHLENVLEEKVGKKIDPGTIDSIHPLVRRYVDADKVALL